MGIARGFQWKVDCHEIRDKIDMGYDETPWSGREHVAMHGVGLTPRHVNMIDTVWGYACEKASVYRLAKNVDDVAQDLYCDLSQNLHLGAFGSIHRIALLTSSRIYSYSCDRVLSPDSLLKTLGYNTPVSFATMPESSTMNLIGEALPLPCLGALLYPLLMSVQMPGFFEHGLQIGVQRHGVPRPTCLSDSAKADGANPTSGSAQSP